jgi:hypothetical protein
MRQSGLCGRSEDPAGTDDPSPGDYRIVHHIGGRFRAGTTTPAGYHRMLPPAPMPLAALGTVWYGGLFCGLSRALAAPWLDPWWLVRGMRHERLRPPERAAPAARSRRAPERAATAQSSVPAREATIIPFDRARIRALARREMADPRG